MGFGRHFDQRAARRRLTIACLPLTLGCQSLTHIEVQYRDCFEPVTPYIAQFDAGTQELEERCWRIEGTGAGRNVTTSDGDLLIGYDSPPDVTITWADDGPALMRQVRGDFILVTHVEATERLNSSFCLSDDDSAGVVVRGTEHGEIPELRAAWMLRPDPVQAQKDCNDDVEIGAVLQADATSAPTSTATSPVGMTGEADMAVCRSGSQLAYFYRNPKDEDAPWAETDWRALEVVAGDASTTRIDEVGTGPLDVGVMATASSDGKERQVQGAFNWVALLADGNIGADCRGPLEAMKAPEND